MPRKVFISYRREDSAGYAGRLHDRLLQEFGDTVVFIDVDSIPLGIDFVKRLTMEVANCNALLAMIGPRWINARDKKKKRRLDNPRDPVRIEISAALQRDIPVIPILLEGTEVPDKDLLPRNLKPLAVRNGLNVDHASFHADLGRLVRELRGLDAEDRAKPAPTISEYYVSCDWTEERQAEINWLISREEENGKVFFRAEDANRIGNNLAIFMDRIVKGTVNGRVCIVLSQQYLKSPYCMNELSTLWRNARGKPELYFDKIRMFVLPIVKLATSSARIKYFNYWRTRLDELEVVVGAHGQSMLSEKDYIEFSLASQLVSEIPEILAFVQDVLHPRSFADYVNHMFD